MQVRSLVLVLVVTLTSWLSGNAVGTSAQASAPEVDAPACPADYRLQYGSITTPGVALCEGVIGSVAEGFNLTWVDLTAGAQMRVVSDHVEGSGHGGDARFHKRSMSGWWDYLKNWEGPINPTPDRLAYVVNAGFMIETSGTTTPLSLPEIRTEGQVMSTGYAEVDRTDAAWGVVPKMALFLGDPNSPTRQQANIYGWGDQVTGAYDVAYVHRVLVPIAYDLASGFPSWKAPFEGDVDRPRTFAFKHYDSDLGHNLLGIMTYMDPLLGGVTLAEMNAEIRRIVGWNVGGLTIQFDGGRSTSYCAEIDTGRYCEYPGPLGGRDVPEVLAVYSAPE